MEVVDGRPASPQPLPSLPPPAASREAPRDMRDEAPGSSSPRRRSSGAGSALLSQQSPHAAPQPGKPSSATSPASKAQLAFSIASIMGSRKTAPGEGARTPSPRDRREAPVRRGRASPASGSPTREHLSSGPTPSEITSPHSNLIKETQKSPSISRNERGSPHRHRSPPCSPPRDGSPPRGHLRADSPALPSPTRRGRDSSPSPARAAAHPAAHLAAPPGGPGPARPVMPIPTHAVAAQYYHMLQAAEAQRRNLSAAVTGGNNSLCFILIVCVCVCVCV